MIGAAVSGTAVEYLDALDRVIVRGAKALGALPMMFSPVMNVSDLQRMNHFESFPHLTTLVARPDMNAAEPMTTQPVAEALITAACYPVYAALQGQVLSESLMITTRNTCFRLEDSYVPLQRQWAFTMREVVCVGSTREAADFVAGSGRMLLDELASQLGLITEWVQATDPFFNPTSGPALVQLTEPVKFELVFDNQLALGSTNSHHDHFGRAFDITSSGKPVETACVAFGLERWLAALIETHGPNANNWPSL